MTGPEKMKRFTCRKSLLRCDYHFDKYIVALGFHELGRATESIDCKLSPRHLLCRSLHLVNMNSSLHWPGPQDVLTSHRVQSFVCSSQRLVNSPLCTLQVAPEPGWNVENYTNVSVDPFLIIDDLARLNADLSILENLIRS